MSTRVETLSGRERVRLALEHRATDRVPIGMVCAGLNPPVQDALREHLARTAGVDLDRYLLEHVDIVEVVPPYAGPPLRPATDVWGVVRRPVSYGAGSYDEIVHYPLASAATPRDLDAHTWPDPDWFDYEALPALIRYHRKKRDRAVLVSNGNPFETSWYMRGLEQMLVDSLTDPELFRAIMERVTRFYEQYFDRALAASPGLVDLVFTADDVGDQRGLLFPRATWESLIAPYHRRLNHLIHGHGVRVIYHTDGAVMDLVDGLVDMGIDVLQALQFDAQGMDPQRLKQVFGDRLCFEGGVSVQRTLPQGTADDVRREVEDRIRVLGREGGYILGPSHWIQAGTPPQNVAALFDTARSYYPW